MVTEMKRALSSAEPKGTAQRSEQSPSATSEPTPQDSAGNIRADLEQRTHAPLLLAAGQEEASHSAPAAVVILDPPV